MVDAVLVARRFTTEWRQRWRGEGGRVIPAAEGASDQELVRLAGRGARLEIDDVRWDGSMSVQRFVRWW